MFDLTRSSAAAALVVFFIAFGLYLIIRAFTRNPWESGGIEPRWATASAGMVVLIATILLRPSLTFDALRLDIDGTSRLGTIILLAGSILAGAAVADYVKGRLIPLFVGRPVPTNGRDKRRAGLAAAGILASGALMTGAALLLVPILDPRVSGEVSTGSRFDVRIDTEFELESGPRDLVFVSPAQGYLSLEDSIALVELSRDGDELDASLTPITTSMELRNLRGLTHTDGYLFVVQQGASDPNQPEELFSTKGSVLRFVIEDDGSLSNGTVILDQLPVANALHGTNGIATGSDGLLYLSIGAPYLPEGGSDAWPSESPNVEWLGTILRFDANGNAPEVFASGLRNVYDIEFDTAGRLWGVDNDGTTFRDFRAEEVLHIKEGANYGYPFEGTFGEYEMRSDGPVWTYTGREVEGSAGLETADKLNLPSGLFIGARQLTYLRVAETPAGMIASADLDLNGTEVIFDRQGYFTVVEAGPNGLLFIGVDGSPLNSNLYVLQLSE